MKFLFIFIPILLNACQSTYKQGYLTVDEIQGVFNNSVSLATVKAPNGQITLQQLSFSPGTGTILLSEAAKVGAAATFGVAAAPLYKPSQYRTNSTVNNGNSNNAVSQGSVAKSAGGVGLGGIGIGGRSVSGANSTAQGGAATAEGGNAIATPTQNTEVSQGQNMDQGQFQAQDQGQGQFQGQDQGNAGHRGEDDKK